MRKYCIKIRFFHSKKISLSGVIQVFPDYENPSVQTLRINKNDFVGAYNYARAIQKDFSRYIGTASQIVSIEEV